MSIGRRSVINLLFLANILVLFCLALVVLPRFNELRTRPAVEASVTTFAQTEAAYTPTPTTMPTLTPTRAPTATLVIAPKLTPTRKP